MVYTKLKKGNNMKKQNLLKLSVLLLILLLTGCNNTKIQTKYDNYKLHVQGQINGGCYQIEKDNSWSDVYEYDYLLDHKNKVEEAKNSIWVGYSKEDKQYISSDSGKTFSLVENTMYAKFNNNYREKVTKMLELINSSKKKNFKEKNKQKTFKVNFKDNTDLVFELITEFGVVGKFEEIDKLETVVTVDKNNNVSKIDFDIVCKPAEKGVAKNCYRLTWNLSNYNEVTINLPEDLND